MTTLTQLRDRLTRAIQTIENGIEQQAQIAGNDIVALVTNRVIQKGETASGGQFTPYSTKEVPAFFYFNKSRNQSAENRIRDKAKKKEGVSYKEFRQINNLNTSPKNFEFTGEMWRSFSVLSVQRTPGGVTITIGGKTRPSADRIEWNSDREKISIIEPSAAEIAIVQGNLTRWVNGLINV